MACKVIECVLVTSTIGYVAGHPEQVQGLLLWAAYPASNMDLSRQEIRVASISGTMDGLATPEKIVASRTLLPENTFWMPIEGGNHAQFG